MRKFYFIIPVFLLILNILPVSLHKDSVDFGTSLDTLSPRHWLLLDIQANSSFGESTNLATINNSSPTPVNEAISQNADFRGFPFGAYFSKTADTKVAESASYFQASAYSWLWGLMDFAFILASLVFAFRANRGR